MATIDISSYDAADDFKHVKPECMHVVHSSIIPSDQHVSGTLTQRDQDPTLLAAPYHTMIWNKPKTPFSSPVGSHRVSFLSCVSEKDPTYVLSSSRSSGIFCRICHEGESGGERLISPCSCSGSMGLIHKSCIEKWLTTVNHDTCELCKQKFRISRHNRPVRSWLCEPVVGDDQRNLVSDGVCFLILTPLTGITSYLCTSGATFYFKEKSSEAVGLICLSALLLTIYIAWLVLTIRYHCQVWFKWRYINQDIRLLEVSGLIPSGYMVEDREVQRLKEEDINIFKSIDKVDGGARINNEYFSPDRQYNSPIPNPILLDPSTVDGLGGCVPIAPRQTDDLKSGMIEVRETLPLKEVPIEKLKESNMCKSSSLPVATIQSQSTSESHAPEDYNSKDVDSNEVRAGSDGETILSRFSSNITPTQFKTVSVPYLPDLKEQFIAVRSRQEPGSKSVRSRGTFSPIKKSKKDISSLYNNMTSSFSSSTPTFQISSEERYRHRPLPPIPGMVAIEI